MGQSWVVGAPVDLETRDPDFLRRQLAMWWLLAAVYFRAEVEGFEKVPTGPVMFVGNHSGGSVPIDSLVFLLGFATYFGVDRPLYALGHATLTSLPGLGPFVRKLGVVTAGPEAARSVFGRDASVLVYPGGDLDVFRPWSKRHRIMFGGRTGFLRTAHEAGVPIVPVVADGGHDTLMILNDGRRLARWLRADRIGRLKSLPVALALPWGITIDAFGHIPFPAKIRMEVLDPIDLHARYGDDLDVDDAYGYVTSTMQAGLSRLATRRILPPIL